MMDDHSTVDITNSDIVIRRRNGQVVAAIPQFGLFAEADTFKNALDELEIKKQDLQADLMAFANLQSYPTGDASPPSNIRWREINLFAIKSCIVLAVVIVATLFASYHINQSISSTIYKIQDAAQANLDRFTVESGSVFWTKVTRELDRAANSNMTKETKQKLLTDIRKIVDKWRPFVIEASGIFAAAPMHELQQPTSDKK
jgi:hypothetical protein